MAELIDKGALLEQYGLKDATKYGNKDAEQQAHSYSTLMLYEIADMIEDAPTTTESKIKAKALKYAQSRFRNTYETMVVNKMENCINWADMFDSMVAEQLKEE